jgi:hypothetical protein
MIDISKNKSEYQNQIRNFLSQLDEESYFIKVSTERVLNSKILLVEPEYNEIVGLCALSKWHGLYKSYFLFKKVCQGKGLGKQSSIQLNESAKGKYNLIVGAVDPANKGMLKVCLSTGYKIIGRRKNIIYLIDPLNFKGEIIYLLFKLLFPLVSLIFSIVMFNKRWEPEI